MKKTKGTLLLDIVTSETFMLMSRDAQAAYLQINARSDSKRRTNRPRAIAKAICADPASVDELLANRFLVVVDEEMGIVEVNKAWEEDYSQTQL